MRIDLKVGCEGWYKIEAVKADGSRRLLADWFPNLITDQGLNRMGANSDYLLWCQVGSGDNTPAFTDTTLETFVAATSNQTAVSTGAQPSSPYFIAHTITYRFAEGVAAGNLSEVGIAWTSGASSLFSRALIVDSLGAPTTITVLSDEFLDVTYQLRIYPPTTDVTGTIVISGISYDYTLRAAYVTTVQTGFGVGWSIGTAAGCLASNSSYGAMTGAIGAITTGPSGTQSQPSTATNAAYGTNNLYRDSSFVWDLTRANFNVLSILVGLTWATYQIEFDPFIPKDNTKILTLTFRQTWARKTLP